MRQEDCSKCQCQAGLHSKILPQKKKQKNKKAILASFQSGETEAQTDSLQQVSALVLSLHTKG